MPASATMYQDQQGITHLAILGPFDFTHHEQLIPGITWPKMRVLLAYLAVEAGYAHSREKLATLLWPEHSKKQAY